MNATPAALTHDTPVGTTPVARAERARRVGRTRPWSSVLRTAVAGGLALGLHALAFAATSGLPCGFSHGPRLRAELDPAADVIPLEMQPEPVAPEPVAPEAAPDALAAAPRVATARAAAAPSPAAPDPAPAPSAPAEPHDFTSLAGAFQGATSYAMARSRAVVGAVSGALGRGHAGGTGAGGAGGNGAGTSGAASPGASAQPAQAPRAVNSDWSCPWPAAAIAADLYQQNVTVRVQVGVDGAVERATARDPGHGFGPAAAACARRERFHPARDGAGQPVRATALVRVHFER